MNMTINGVQALINWDLAGDAFSHFKAVALAFNTTSDANGNIKIAYNSSATGVGICGIEVLAGSQAVGSPTGLTATTGLSQATLNWTAPTGATGYNILRSTSSSGPFVRTNPNLLTSTTFTDTGLVGCQTYYYEAEAVNSVGEGLACAPVSVVPLSISISVNPSTINAAAGSTVAVTVTFSGCQPINFSLSVSGAPKGVTTFLYPSAVSLAVPVTLPSVTLAPDPANAVFNILIGSNVTPGTYTLNVTATVGTLTVSNTATLSVH